MRTLAAELAAIDVDVIVTISTPAALAVRQVTSTIPIVMAGSSDPVENGLVTSLAHSGGNVTGLTNNPGGDFVQKMIQFLKEAPGVSHVGVLWDSANRAEARLLTTLQAPALTLGITVLNGDARDATAIPAALTCLVRAGANGLYVSPSALNTSQMMLIVDFALANRLPSIFGDKRFVSEGGLMSYWTDWPDLRRRSAVFVDKILKGAKPADLPLEQPTKLELVINLKTAKRSGTPFPGHCYCVRTRSFSSRTSVSCRFARFVERPDVADSVSCRGPLTADLGRPSPRIEGQLPVVASYSHCRPSAASGPCRLVAVGRGRSQTLCRIGP